MYTDKVLNQIELMLHHKFLSFNQWSLGSLMEPDNFKHGDECVK